MATTKPAYFSKLRIHTHLSESQKTELAEILAADEVGSETSFEFYCSLDYEMRGKLYQFVCECFPARIIVMSNVDEHWVMLSMSVSQAEMDNPLLEESLDQVVLNGMMELGIATPVKIQPPPSLK